VSLRRCALRPSLHRQPTTQGLAKHQPIGYFLDGRHGGSALRRRRQAAAGRAGWRERFRWTADDAIEPVEIGLHDLNLGDRPAIEEVRELTTPAVRTACASAGQASSKVTSPKLRPPAVARGGLEPPHDGL
jgi:hypothetical protein